MPTRFLKDDNGNDSSMRLVFIVFMVVTVTMLVIIAALMIRSHLAGAGDTNAFDDLLKWLTTGSLGGFLAKVAQKYLERRQPQSQPKPQSQPQSQSQPQPQHQPQPQPQPQPDPFRSLPDKQLTRNFRLYEMIEATPTGNQEFIRMNWENIGEFNEGLARQLAEYLQWARNLINQRYQQENDGQEISLVITSAYRCHAWEISQHRSGTSMHTKSLAADWFPRTKSLQLSARILKDLHKEWESTVYGHQGGLAIKFPSYDRQGKMITCGYLHTDLGRPRRWTY